MNFAFAIAEKILHCYFLLLVHAFPQKKEAEIGRRIETQEGFKMFVI